METFRLTVHTDENGVLKLEVPTGFSAQEVELVLVMQVRDREQKAVDANGWPLGFFERTYGALADDPIERPPQLPLEERDAIE